MKKDTYLIVRIAADDKERIIKMAQKKRVPLSQLLRNYVLEILDLFDSENVE